MGLFWQNNNTIQEEDGELENYSTKMKQSLAELHCEEAIIEDKERFCKVRKSMMNVLRAKHGHEIEDRILNRVNKKIQKGHFNQKSFI